MSATFRMALIGIVLTLSGGAFAQTAEQRAACDADFKKYCAGTIPGGGRIIACLDKHKDKLSDACKKVVASQKK